MGHCIDELSVTSVQWLNLSRSAPRLDPSEHCQPPDFGSTDELSGSPWSSDLVASQAGPGRQTIRSAANEHTAQPTGTETLLSDLSVPAVTMGHKASLGTKSRIPNWGLGSWGHELRTWEHGTRRKLWDAGVIPGQGQGRACSET